MDKPSFILTLTCPDQIGIIAALARLLERQTGLITSSRSFSDTVSGQFFVRLQFCLPETSGVGRLRAETEEVAASLKAKWTLTPADHITKVLLMVSKSDHCANTLLYAARRGELPIDIVGIASNHNTLKSSFEHWDRPWFHIPVDANNKTEAEDQLFATIQKTSAELVVLARYMQILSNPVCQQLQGRCINIHHSFLPSFKGARPYHQAHDRGVKVIGATAHYVTPDLDEGPIITQVTEPVDHTNTPDDMVAMGRHLEGLALLRAVKAHAEHRVFFNSGRTVVFAR